ncbi:hypothetical protein ACWEOE_38780 [Amycolatopsis sp. NPDC004368]
MSRRRGKPGLRLSFDKRECECGEKERVLALPCPSCGRRPEKHEINAPVQRRQRVVQQIRNTDPDATTEFAAVGAGVFIEVFDGLLGWNEDFLSALDDHEHGIDRARALTGYLLGLEASFRTYPRLRPWRKLYSQIDTILKNLIGVWSSALDAFEAPSMLAAQSAGKALQSHLDAASAAIDQWNRAEARLSANADVPIEDQVVSGAAIALASDENRQRFADELIIRCSVSEPLPPAIREFVLVSIEMASAVGEEDDFVDILEKALAALQASQEASHQIIESSIFQQNFSRSIGEMYRSSSMLHVLAMASGNERLAIDGLVKSAHAIVESSTRHPIALLATSFGTFGYRNALSKGASECVRVLRSNDHHELTIGLDLDLRNAEAHRSYKIDDDLSIEILNDRGNVKRRISAPELLDCVVAGNILALALTLAVIIFASRDGIEVLPLLESAENLPLEQSVQMMAIALGWPVPRVYFDRHALRVEIHGAPELEISFEGDRSGHFLAAISIASRLPSHVRTLDLYSESGDPTEIFVDTARALSTKRNQFDKSLAFLEIFSSITRSGSRIISRHHWDMIVSTLARQSSSTADVAGLRKLIQLRALLFKVGDEHGANALNETIDTCRASIAGPKFAAPRATLPDLGSFPCVRVLR